MVRRVAGRRRGQPRVAAGAPTAPVVAAADHILDIHSTSHDGGAFWVYPDFPRNARAALSIGAGGASTTHLVMPSGLGSGTPLIQHGRHGLPGEVAGAALVVECGQHFLRSSAEVATRTALDFLAHFGLISVPATTAAPAPQRRFELLRTCMVQTESFEFTRPLSGFETFAEGELIATDGSAGEIRSPCDECTVFMPTRRPIVGREAVYLTKPLSA